MSNAVRVQLVNMPVFGLGQMWRFNFESIIFVLILYALMQDNHWFPSIESPRKTFPYVQKEALHDPRQTNKQQQKLFFRSKRLFLMVRHEKKLYIRLKGASWCRNTHKKRHFASEKTPHDAAKTEILSTTLISISFLFFSSVFFFCVVL